MKTFKELQSQHETLLPAKADKTLAVETIDDFIKETIESSRKISSPGDRDQLRANLRYWANHI